MANDRPRPREVQKRLKELAAALKADPGSIPRRLELAAALREADRPADAIELYRGVAEVYAEEGRLVQAMAVCKGILEIDREHRDTLEMLATLAQRRAAKKPPAELKQQEDGRWVAEPTDADAEAATPPVAGLESTPRARTDWREEEDSELSEGLHTSDGTATAALSEDEVAALQGLSSLGAEEPKLDTDPSMPIPAALAAPPAGDVRENAVQPDVRENAVQAPPLDFPPEVKKMGRGDRLMDLAPPTLPTPRLSAAELAAGGEAEAAAATDGTVAERPDETRAATRSALDAGRLASSSAYVDLNSTSPELGLYEEEPSDTAVIQDVLTVPFPRSPLTDEPPPFPLLSDLPRGAFMELLTRVTVLKLDGGVNVLREGELGDACYLIASGSVRVTKNDVELAVLGPGSFFGEFAVLADQRRHASVETVEPVELLEIRRALIDELVAAHPGVARTLRRFYRERLLQTLTATAPFFSRLTHDERVAVADRFRPRRFGRAARIVEEGAPGGGLFLILVGEVQVVRGAAEEEVELGRLGEGSYFGEMSLLRGGVASATVRATRMTEVVQLPPRDFYEVVSQHPVLWEQLRSEAERRELANHAILAGEARKSEDGTIYLV